MNIIHSHIHIRTHVYMIKKIFSSFRNFFDSVAQRQNDLDQYIYDKNPRDLAELEYWLRRFDKSRSTKLWH